MTGLFLPQLPFPLTHEGSPECVPSMRDGALVLAGGPESDLFVEPGGAGPLPDAGRLIGLPPGGDFTFKARVTVDFSAVYDAGVLVLYANPHRWAKLCFEYSPQREPMAVSVVTKGTSDDANSIVVDGHTLWLRMTRIGMAWAFHVSTDGTWWHLIRYFSVGVDQPGDEIRVGFIAQSPTGEGCTAVFEDIEFVPGAPADLRDGS